MIIDSSKYAIEVANLRKYYGTSRGIERVSFKVAQGTIHGFLGPNGAGKTTTIRILISLLKPDRGNATILGYNVNNPIIKKLIGYIPSDFEIYKHYTVKEYLDFVETIRGFAPLRDKLVERFRIDESRLCKELSRGNKQKVAIVQAFMHKPPLVIADEPTTGLDPLMQEEFANFIRDYANKGHTILLSSHILSEVQELCDYVSIIRDGTIVNSGKVEGLLRNVPRKAVLLSRGKVSLKHIREKLGVEHISMEREKIIVYYEIPTLEFLDRLRTIEGIYDLRLPEPSLEEFFLAMYQ